MIDSTTTSTESPSVAMPVEELRGRSVWTDAGDELGKLRDFRTDSSGRIVALEVQHGWMFGHKYVVDAVDMRIDEGSVIVPAANVQDVARSGRRSARVASVGTAAGTATAPSLIAGRAGARNRFGGLSLAAGLIGALTAFASAIIIGGLMSAIFTDVGTVNFDDSFTGNSDLWASTMIGGAVTLALSMLIGGWAAGRVARFNGVSNGLSVTAWVFIIAAVLTGLGAWIGDTANAFDAVNVPHVDWSTVTTTAVIGMVIGVAIMLVFGALGGALGALYNHAVDRSMLSPAHVGTVDDVDYSDDNVVSHRTIADEDIQRHDVGVVGTPAGSPVAPREIPTSDSPKDVRRFD
jgi:sporulation protein YlmC with PRC-barrel domain